MSDSRVIFKQQRDLAAYEKTIRQLEVVILEYRALLQEACSVACGFAWDIGAGNNPMTSADIEIALALEKKE